MLILKGIIVGLGKIIPGVSGSMLAISLGIYQRLIDSINNFFKNPKKNLEFLLKVFIGISISIIFFSNIIVNLLKNYYLFTILFFIGLIIGSINDIKNKCKRGSYIPYIVFLSVVLFGLTSVNNNLIISKNIIGVITLIICGFIDAITMVVPGISGTAILMMIGVYNTIIYSISSILNYDKINDNLFILIPFLFGMIIGVLITSKFVDYLFKNHSDKTYSAIIGFSYSTVFLMFIKIISFKYKICELVVGTILLFLGILISKKINRISG